VRKNAAENMLALHRGTWLDGRPDGSAGRPDRAIPPLFRCEIACVVQEVSAACDQLFWIDPRDRCQRPTWEPPMRARRWIAITQQRRVWAASQATWPDTVWVSIVSLFEKFPPQGSSSMLIRLRSPGQRGDGDEHEERNVSTDSAAIARAQGDKRSWLVTR
jgi:hypothetical protein